VARVTGDTRRHEFQGVSRMVLRKAAVVVPILVLIAVIHVLRIGTHLTGNLHAL
jgi:hypothetical protein